MENDGESDFLHRFFSYLTPDSPKILVILAFDNPAKVFYDGGQWTDQLQGDPRDDSFLRQSL
jgi:hypothetical protein